MCLIILTHTKLEINVSIGNRTLPIWVTNFIDTIYICLIFRSHSLFVIIINDTTTMKTGQRYLTPV